MNYERLELIDGVTKWDAAKVKHLEDGIVANEEAIERYHNDSVVEMQADWNQNDETAKNYIKNKPFTVTKCGGRKFETKINDPQYTWVTDDYMQLNGGHIVGDRYSEQEDLWITENDISEISDYDGAPIGYKFPHGYWIKDYQDTDIPYETLVELEQLGINSKGLWLDTYIVEDYYRWPYEFHSYEGDPISPGLIPNTIARAPKAIFNNIEEAPTASDFNTLLSILREAGILATE